MSVVIVGGHDRMVCQYKKICKDYHCKAKIFTQMSGNLKNMIGSPDLLILFTIYSVKNNFIFNFTWFCFPKVYCGKVC